MVEIDFTNVDDAEDFSPLPDDDYPFEVVHAEQKSTKEGKQQISMQMSVLDGEFAGRRFWDNLALTPTALGRLKLVLGRLGFNVSGPLRFEPEDLIGRRGIATLETREYTDGEGKLRKANKVTFAGYRPLPQEGFIPSSTRPAGQPAKSQIPIGDAPPF